MRDLAAWIVHAAEDRVAGPFNATGPTTMGAVIDSAKRVTGSTARPVEVAYFVPAGEPLTNNVDVDERGYVYIVDRGGLGLHVLALTGAARTIADLPTD